MIYFLRYKTPKGAFSPIAIGFIEDEHRLRTRIATYSIQQPWLVDTIGTAAGGERLLREIHSLFEQAHLRNQWFKATRAIERLADWCRNNPGARPGEVLEAAHNFAGVPIVAPLTSPKRRAKVSR